MFFGEYLDNMPDEFLNRYTLNSYSFILDSGYLFVLPYLGRIYKYDKDFKLTQEFDLLDLSLLEKSREYMEQYYLSSSNSLVSLIADCKIVSGQLVLLIYERDSNMPANPRKVLVVSISGEIKVEKMITLGEDENYFTKFSHIDQNKYAFFENQTSSMQIFEFP